MNTYPVTLTLSIAADSAADAREIAEGACEHLRETFNDDDSIEAADVVDTPPEPPGIDTPAPEHEAARLESIGAEVARVLQLPRVGAGPDRGRYRTTDYGTKTAQGLGAVVERIVMQGGAA